MRRREARELLDDDQGTAEEIERSLGELWWINQHLGGLRTWRKLLERWGGAADVRGGRLLDVGAGTGQVAEWLGKRLGLTAVALDRRVTHLGRQGARVAGDALRLPFADGSFDVVTCNLFLHHFHGEAAERLLGEMLRVARRAVLVNDLERGWVPWLAFQAVSPRFSRLTRHDGPRSVGQAYTRRELEALGKRVAAAAGGGVRVAARRLWPYRLGLVLERCDPGIRGCAPRLPLVGSPEWR